MHLALEWIGFINEIWICEERNKYLLKCILSLPPCCLWLIQSPPSYEESIRQSVELPYNILSPSLDIPSPQTVNTSPGCSTHSSTLLPVWCGTSPPTSQWMWREALYPCRTFWSRYLKLSQKATQRGAAPYLHRRTSS